MPTTAGTVVTSVRGLVPDPVYIAGVAQPDTDGAFTRASLLYQWLDSGIKALVDASQWFVEDWFAMQLVANQPFYAVDEKWIRVEEGFVNQWPIQFVNEGDTVYPTRAMSQQPIWGTWHRRTSRLEVGGYPVINVSDPTGVTLTAPLSATATGSASVSSTVGFLKGGGASGAWVQIDSELLQYQTVSTGAINVLTRGCAGTTAAAHLTGATVQHLGFWVKGRRVPVSIADSTSIIELPVPWIHHLEAYLLAKIRRSENEHDEARKLMGDFDKACAMIAANPGWKQSQGTQVRAYGEPVLGPLAWEGTTVVP